MPHVHNASSGQALDLKRARRHTPIYVVHLALPPREMLPRNGPLKVLISCYKRFLGKYHKPCRLRTEGLIHQGTDCPSLTFMGER